MIVFDSTTIAKRINNLLTKHSFFQILIAAALLYVLVLTVQIPSRFSASFDELSQTQPVSFHRRYGVHHSNKADLHHNRAPARPSKRVTHRFLSGLELDQSKLVSFVAGDSELYRSAASAVEVGKHLWHEIGNRTERLDRGHPPASDSPRSDPELSCPNSASVSGSELAASRNLMVIPCGLTLGSSVTVVGKPRAARAEVSNGKEVKVSEFKVELEGLKTVDGEEPPKVLHFNPRLKGDWSGRPVVEMNTCYRMQWGSSMRCEGWGSRPDDETVDGKVKCEKWIQGDGSHLEETKATWWLNKLIGSRNKKMMVDWPFPFAEEKLFVLTISARLEGYHINVDGRHVASFPYRTGFTLEDATGLSVSGDVDVHSVYAASLPSSHPSFTPQRSLEMSSKWRAPPLPKGEVELFIGILSAGNHFAERMAVRKSWMQHRLIQSSSVVARFFVALNGRKEVNAELKKEAEFFGDIVIVPYLDSYDLVVLKTIAICEHGARSVPAKYVMKCDDDTFVKLDAVLSEARKIPEGKSFYIGNINYLHKPLRSGKWAVTYEEWSEEIYPPYANGPGYIMSTDLANFTVSEFERNKLRLFKMEDVSMGMWVEKFNSTKPVQYVHDFKFCQFGCIEDYLTAHYQSPRQMICLWERLQRKTRPQCCNMR